MSNLRFSPLLLTIGLIAILGIGLILAIARPDRSNLADTTAREVRESALPSEVIAAAVEDIEPACSEAIFMLHTLASSRTLSSWDILRLRLARKCRSFRLVSVRPDKLPQTNNRNNIQQRWCLIVHYSYQNLGDEWVEAEIAITASKVQDRWQFERGPWLQPPGHNCPQQRH